MRKLALFLFSLTLLHATTIYGDIYNADDFESVPGVIIKISGPASIQLVAQEGNYSAELPAGSYLLQAFHYGNNSLEYYSYARLNVTDDMGSLHFDIVLFKPEMLEVFYETYEDAPVYEALNKKNGAGQASGETSQQGSEQENDYSYLIALVLLFLLLAAATLAFRFFKPAGNKEGKPRGDAPGRDDGGSGFMLDDDGKAVVALLESNEGRMLQRELRQSLKFSETKMSLLLDELEVNKIIKRIKKGRGNIIKLLRRDKNG